LSVNKLERFAENATFENVIEHTDFKENGKKPKGSWHHVFENPHPITLELACGTGACTLELAKRNPEVNFIGIDIKGARIWKGAKKAKAEEVPNVRFLRIFIEEIDEYFAKSEVNEIWITFPDPYPRAGDRSKRLTSPRFLENYVNILQPGGIVHFKTDDTDFFQYTCREVQKFGGTFIQKVPDIYGRACLDDRLNIQTVYEKRHLKQGKTISYCAFTF
jgi:tRNA (guanine-N7-)-methyltransferase